MQDKHLLDPVQRNNLDLVRTFILVVSSPRMADLSMRINEYILLPNGLSHIGLTFPFDRTAVVEKLDELKRKRYEEWARDCMRLHFRVKTIMILMMSRDANYFHCSAARRIPLPRTRLRSQNERSRRHGCS